MSELQKQIIKEIEFRTQSLKSIANGCDVSYPTLAKVMRGEKVSDKVLKYLETVLK